MWQSVDPLAVNGSHFNGNSSTGGVYDSSNNNPYSYVHNRPVIATDPSGKDIILLIGGPYKGHPYGHVAIAIIDKSGKTVVLDFGRYRNVSGTFSESGEGVLRIHTSITSYIENENKTGRTTTAYQYKTTSEQDSKVADHFIKLIENNVEIIDGDATKDNMYSFKLKNDYHATGNNCTTLSLDGVLKGLPELYEKLSDPKESKGRGLGWSEKIADKTIGNNSLGNKIFMPEDLRKNIEKTDKHIKSEKYSSKNKK